jgi:hypothetical protein
MPSVQLFILSGKIDQICKLLAIKQRMARAAEDSINFRMFPIRQENKLHEPLPHRIGAPCPYSDIIVRCPITDCTGELCRIKDRT